MALRIVETAAALNDVIEIADYIEQRADLDVAYRVVDAIRAAYQHIAEIPSIGTTYDPPNYPGLRRYVVQRYRNYLVFYQANEDTVTIVRVIYGARDYRTMFEGP